MTDGRSDPDGPGLVARVVTAVYRRATLMVRHLDHAAAVPPAGPVRTAQLEPDDIGAYAAFRGPKARTLSVGRMDVGHVAFVTWSGSEIVSAVWVARRCARLEYLQRDIHLQVDEALTYDSYTAPQFRRRGMVVTRDAVVFRALSDAGTSRCYGIVAHENAAGMRAALASGYRAVRDYRLVRAAAWDYCWRAGAPFAPVDSVLPSVLEIS